MGKAWAPLLLLLLGLGCSTGEKRAPRGGSVWDDDGGSGSTSSPEPKANRTETKAAGGKEYDRLLDLLSRPDQLDQKQAAGVVQALARVAPRGDRKAIKALLAFQTFTKSKLLQGHCAMALLALGFEGDEIIFPDAGPSADDRARIRSLIESLKAEDDFIRTRALAYLRQVTNQDYGLNFDQWLAWYDREFPKAGKKR